MARVRVLAIALAIASLALCADTQSVTAPSAAGRGVAPAAGPAAGAVAAAWRADLAAAEEGVGAFSGASTARVLLAGSEAAAKKKKKKKNRQYKTKAEYRAQRTTPEGGVTTFLPIEEATKQSEGQRAADGESMSVMGQGADAKTLDALAAQVGDDASAQEVAAADAVAGEAKEGEDETEAKGEEKKAEGVAPEEKKAEGAAPKEKKADDAAPKETKAEDAAPEETKAEGVAPEEKKAEGVVPEEKKAEDAAPEETKAEGVAPEEKKAEGVVPEEKKAEDAALKETKAEDAAPKETRAEDAAPEASSGGGKENKGAEADAGGQAVVVASLGESSASLSSLAVSSRWIVTNQTISKLLGSIATPEKEIIFTTAQLPPGDSSADVGMLANFFYWLDRTNLMQHSMLLTTDNATVLALRARGLPAYLDLAYPKRPGFGSGVDVPDSPNRVFDVQKHWWGWATVRHGYRALYLDGDAVVLRNPLGPFRDTSFDVQGLSDWEDMLDVPRGSALNASCHLYHNIKFEPAPLTSIIREWWRFPSEQPSAAYESITPCQSTGTWYLQPTERAEAFMHAMVTRLLHPSTLLQWDQTAWNEVILPFLWGAENVPPLSYRLLPDDFAANVNPVDKRAAEGIPTSLTVLHSGNLHGSEKARAYARMGFWNPLFDATAEGRKRNAALEERALAAKPGEGANAGNADEPSLTESALSLPTRPYAPLRAFAAPAFEPGSAMWEDAQSVFTLRWALEGRKRGGRRPGTPPPGRAAAAAAELPSGAGASSLIAASVSADATPSSYYGLSLFGGRGASAGGLSAVAASAAAGAPQAGSAASTSLNRLVLLKAAKRRSRLSAAFARGFAFVAGGLVGAALFLAPRPAAVGDALSKEGLGAAFAGTVKRLVGRGDGGFRGSLAHAFSRRAFKLPQEKP